MHNNWHRNSYDCMCLWTIIRLTTTLLARLYFETSLGFNLNSYQLTLHSEAGLIIDTETPMIVCVFEQLLGWLQHFARLYFETSLGFNLNSYQSTLHSEAGLIIDTETPMIVFVLEQLLGWLQHCLPDCILKQV